MRTGEAFEGSASRRREPNLGERAVGIIAGGGILPAAVAQAATNEGRAVFIAGLSGFASKEIEQFPHAYVPLGAVGTLLKLLRSRGCRELVLVGGLRRPNLFRMKFDHGFIRHFPQLVRLFKGGDDSVLRRVASFFEGQGFTVVGCHEFVPSLLAPVGVFSKHPVSRLSVADIALGVRVVNALGTLDIGQAAVVSRGYVLAVEAAEGTDAMLARCANLNRCGAGARKGVLVKAPKPRQDLRFDLPTIGSRTVELAAEAGLAGIAVAAGVTLLADPVELVKKADKLGLFLYGIDTRSEQTCVPMPASGEIEEE